MTREEHIIYLKNLRTALKLANNFSNETMESLNKAIEVLEQEQCEDAISREATIKYLNTNMAWYDEDGEIADSEEKIKAITDLVNGVPPYTPKQKTGKWIYDENGMDWNLAAWICSECHVRNMNIPPNMKFGKNDVRKIANPLMFQGSKFCPNCGAKMEVEG